MLTAGPDPGKIQLILKMTMTGNSKLFAGSESRRMVRGGRRQDAELSPGVADRNHPGESRPGRDLPPLKGRGYRTSFVPYLLRERLDGR